MKTKKKKNHRNDFDFYRKWEATRKNVFKEDDKKVDRISNLPDDILAHILSLLSLREATRAKILSTRWLRLDSAAATIVSLDFPFPTERQRHLLCNGYIQSAKVNKASMLEYISWLDETLDYYEGRFDEKKKIHKFKIDIPSIPEADPKYLKWLEFALSRETESIDIRMIYWKRFNEDHHHDLSLLPTMEKSMASMPNIKCIKELSLSQVRLESYSCGGEDEVWSFLSKLVCLERLSIESLQCLCPELNVHGIAQLKHLNISKFSKDITSIRVYDMKNLASLRCHGLEFYVLDVKNVPELVDFTIVSTHSERDGKVVIPNVHDKVYDSIVFPQLSRVRLSIRLNRGTGNQDYYVAPFFERLKRMELGIVMEEECSIRPLFSLIETFFAMEELEIKYLKGSWAGDKPLKDLFPRLYQLSANRDGTVRDMGRWVNNRWSWEVQWRRALLDRELEGVEELYNQLHNFSVNDDATDAWVWGSSNSNGIFSVRVAYTELSGRFINSNHTEQPWNGFNHLWKSFAPLKAQLMAWRLVHNRLPTRDNLSKRFELAPEGKVCCCCNLYLETAVHFFLHCTAAYQIWCRVSEWVGVHWAPANGIKSHFVQFSGLLGGGKFRKRLGGLWICVVWVLWRWRNAVIFDRKEWDFRRIEEEIKCRFWSWCAARRDVETNLSFEVWNKNLLPHF